MFRRFSILAALLVTSGFGFLLPATLAAQVIELSGGDSSLYQATGATVTLSTSNYNLSLGAGSVNGRFMEGARMVKPTPDGTWIVGDDHIDFRLPTDVFDDGHFLLVRGIGYRSSQKDSDLVAFVGTDSQNYTTPFFSAAKFGVPVGVLFVKKNLDEHWQFLSDTVASYNWTEIAALKWSPNARTEVGFSGGIGDRHPFLAASLKMERKRYDLEAAYIDASQQFRRVASLSPVFSEANKENILANFRPWKPLSLSAGIQNFLVPLLPESTAEPAYSEMENAQSSVEHAGANLGFLGAQLSGVFLRSTFNQQGFAPASNHSVALSAMREMTPWCNLQSSYFVSKPKGTSTTQSFVANISQQLNPHLSILENVTYSNGHTGINFGGQILSNRITVSATYDTVFVPAQNTQPFQQALLLDVKFRLLGRLLLHGASYVDPTGHLRYTGDLNTVVNRGPAAQQTSAETPLGRFVMRGCVVDARGAPVEGAAFYIDEKSVFSDSAGCFAVWENHPRTHRLTAALSQFLDGGFWQVVSMPATISSTGDEKSLEATVMISLRRLSAPALPAAESSSAAGINREP